MNQEDADVDDPDEAGVDKEKVVNNDPDAASDLEVSDDDDIALSIGLKSIGSICQV